MTALASFDGERSKSVDIVQHVNQQRITANCCRVVDDKVGMQLTLAT